MKDYDAKKSLAECEVDIKGEIRNSLLVRQGKVDWGEIDLIIRSYDDRADQTAEGKELIHQYVVEVNQEIRNALPR